MMNKDTRAVFIEAEDQETLEHNLQREPEDWEIPAFATNPIKKETVKAKEKSLDRTDKALMAIGTICMVGGLLMRI